ncbi:MAG: RluA family pseudouridine synthase [Pseudomonadota bacterium]|nr:RluA family pseudouridine synthase [Pseudomonadota bacterium]
MNSVQTIEVAEGEDGMRLDRWFRQHYPKLGHAHLQKLLRTGQIRVDGGRAKANARLETGQKVRVPPVGDAAALAAVERPTPDLNQKDSLMLQQAVLHKDSDVIVLNKPYGLAVQGGTKTDRHLEAMFDALIFDADDRPRLVHRLDRDTTGVLLLARSRAVARDLGRVFRTRSARKIYWALVAGVPKPAQGKIDVPLKKVRTAEGDRVVAAELGDKEAQRAVTHYAVLGRVGDLASWVTLKPVTGRTHQLRAHMDLIGHPIVGDPKYGRRLEFQGGEIPNKLHLHARRLTLPHPRGGTLDVTAPLPEHMRRTWETLGLDETVEFDPMDAGD